MNVGITFAGIVQRTIEIKFNFLFRSEVYLSVNYTTSFDD